VSLTQDKLKLQWLVNIYTHPNQIPGYASVNNTIGISTNRLINRSVDRLTVWLTDWLIGYRCVYRCVRDCRRRICSMWLICKANQSPSPNAELCASHFTIKSRQVSGVFCCQCLTRAVLILVKVFLHSGVFRSMKRKRFLLWLFFSV